VRSIKLDKGTASDPKAKEYKQAKIAGMVMDKTESKDSKDSEVQEEYDAEELSEEVSDTDMDESENEAEIHHKSEREEGQASKERNWWESESNRD